MENSRNRLSQSKEIISEIEDKVGEILNSDSNKKNQAWSQVLKILEHTFRGKAFCFSCWLWC